MVHHTEHLSPGRLLVSAALAMFLCLFLLPQSRADALDTLSPQLKEELAYATGVQAFIYSYPLLHVNHFRYLFQAPASPSYRGPANHLNHSRQLASSQQATAASPNNDTLYTLAFLDLSREPVVIETPAMGDRYYTIQLADFYATNFGDIGTRHNGGKPGRYLIAGPGWQGKTPKGVSQVYRSPTPWAMILLRILVDNQDELEAVHVMQDGFKLSTTAGTALPAFDPRLLPAIPEPGNSEQIWAVINRELTSNPPPPADKALVDQFALVGVGPGQSQDLSQLDPAVIRGLMRAAKTGMEIVTAAADNIAGGVAVNGWDYTKTDIGRYGNDYLYRAGVTRMGLMANDPIEASYLGVYSDSQGNPLQGSNNYRIRFAADQLPPAKAFWSITVYDRATYSLVDNAIGRFSIGDRTAGLQYEEDGGLTIQVGHAMPDSGRKSNWLPAPVEQFYMIMRVYMPEDSVVQQRWEPPAVETVK